MHVIEVEKKGPPPPWKYRGGGIEKGNILHRSVVVTHGKTISHIT